MMLENVCPPLDPPYGEAGDPSGAVSILGGGLTIGEGSTGGGVGCC